MKASRGKTRQHKKEDFLKWLFHKENGHTGFPQDIFTRKAEQLLQEPGVIDELRKEKLIKREDHRWILTEKGRKKALNIIRRHRLYEKFLSEKTGIPPEKWHPLAEKKEHELSEADWETIEKKLGYPLFDPHGDPIPDKHGQWVEIEALPLNEARAGSVVKIVHLEDEPPEIARRIRETGLYHGAVIHIDTVNADKIDYTFEGTKAAIPVDLAVNIAVQQADESEWIPGLMRLSALKKGEEAEIIGLSGRLRGLLRQRLMDLGFVKGARIKIYLKSPLEEPVAYDIKGSTVALRKEQADNILIRRL